MTRKGKQIMRGSVGGFVPVLYGLLPVTTQYVGNERTSLLESNRPATEGDR